jgi:hypothetical protein
MSFGKQAFAGVSCQPIYGSTTGCDQARDITFDLSVQNPTNNTFTDNLELQDGKYKPGQDVFFRLFVKNNTDKPINKITVKTVFPPHAVYSKGDGTYDANTKTLTTTIATLNASDSQNIFITGKILPENQIAGNDTVTCETAQATAAYNDQQISDISQFCIEKRVGGAQSTNQITAQSQTQTKGGLPITSPQPGTKRTPSTGAEALMLLGLLPAGVIGHLLRRKA